MYRDYVMNKTITPTDHLSGSGSLPEMLRALTDHELIEQIAYYQQVMLTQSTDFGRWSAGKVLSTAMGVRNERGLSDWSKQFTTNHPCHVCGKTSVAVEDEGWVCADHRNLDGGSSSADRDGTGESIPPPG
jgi:hypothetical protein